MWENRQKMQLTGLHRKRIALQDSQANRSLYGHSNNTQEIFLVIYNIEKKKFHSIIQSKYLPRPSPLSVLWLGGGDRDPAEGIPMGPSCGELL